jgi:quinol monooxygenase YgiN
MKGSTSDLIVIAGAKAKPGKEAELERALREVAGPTRAQPGCIEFRLLRLKGVRSTIIGFERWASEADHQKHLKARTCKCSCSAWPRSWPSPRTSFRTSCSTSSSTRFELYAIRNEITYSNSTSQNSEIKGRYPDD